MPETPYPPNTAWLQGYAPIRKGIEDFYTRQVYYRIHVRPPAAAAAAAAAPPPSAARGLTPELAAPHPAQDCWNRPICSAPDAWIDVMERTPVNKTE